MQVIFVIEILCLLVSAYRPYTASMGHPSTVWFDRSQISPFAQEHEESIQESCNDIRELVDVEVKNGIPHNRIIVGE